MDVLVIERFVLLKEEQDPSKVLDRDAYLAEFALD
jgi:hypothetical protein